MFVALVHRRLVTLLAKWRNPVEPLEHQHQIPAAVLIQPRPQHSEMRPLRAHRTATPGQGAIAAALGLAAPRQVGPSHYVWPRVNAPSWKRE